jgi:CheY-like chemotaxis protein
MSPKIAIIDDEANLRLLERKFLEKLGYEIGEAGDAEEGLELIRSFKPDVIMLDIFMPGKNGYQLAEELSLDSTLSHIPIIFVTGSDQLVDNDHVSSSILRFRLNKPFSKEQMYEIVDKALAHNENYDQDPVMANVFSEAVDENELSGQLM